MSDSRAEDEAAIAAVLIDSYKAWEAGDPDGMVADYTAIVVSESGILFAGETEVPDTGKVNATWVFEKRNGQWLIAAYHNSPVLAPGQ
jgi:hypothetical protein